MPGFAIYRSPFTSSAALGWLFYTPTFVALLTLLPSLAGEDRGGFLVIWMPLVSIAASLTVGVFMLQRLQAHLVLMTGFAGAAVAVALVWITGSAIGPFFALAVFWGLIQGAGFAMVPQLNEGPNQQSLANGALAQMGNLGNLCGTPIFALILAGGGAGGVTSRRKAVCLYWGKGQDIRKLIAQDRTARKNPQCAPMGCALGTRYTYCD